AGSVGAALAPRPQPRGLGGGEGGGAAQEPDEEGQPGVVEVVEQADPAPADPLPHPAELGRPLRHRRHQHPPPVGRVALAHHVPRPLQPVHQSRRRAGRQPGQLTDPPGRHRPPLQRQQVQALQVAGVQAEPVGDGLVEQHVGGHVAPGRHGQLRQQPLPVGPGHPLPRPAQKWYSSPVSSTRTRCRSLSRLRSSAPPLHTVSRSTTTSDGAPSSRTRRSIRSPTPSTASAPVRHSTACPPERAQPAGSCGCSSASGSDHRSRTVASATADGPWLTGTSRTSVSPAISVATPWYARSASALSTAPAPEAAPPDSPRTTTPAASTRAARRPAPGARPVRTRRRSRPTGFRMPPPTPHRTDSPSSSACIPRAGPGRRRPTGDTRPDRGDPGGPLRAACEAARMLILRSAVLFVLAAILE